MRLRRSRFTVRRMMIALAVIGLAIAYIIRYYKYNSIANSHLQAFEAIYKGQGLISLHGDELDNYHESNYHKYKRAAIYPWVRLPPRFVPFVETRRSATVP